MPNLNGAIEFMRKACNDWSLGYDQSNRWDIRDGGECDCSSLVITALKRNGFDTGSASYTGDMSYNLTRRGWARIPADLTKAQPGDILLNDTYHTCMVIKGRGWSSTIAQASLGSNGRITGDAPGDQNGRETNTRGIYTYSMGWDCMLRYTEAPAPKPTPAGKLDVDGIAGRLTVTAWQKALKTPADGVISGQVLINRPYLTGFTAIEWTGDGSQLIQAAQRRIIRDGISVGSDGADGYIGQGTVFGLQRWLGLKGFFVASEYDLKRGIAGAETVKALQRSLNAGAWS